ncbi:serine hydrolase domain-containing protein [Paenibacillus senegalensis]|uniref:serine hydrolase domain-containing protein n=1 Tax=Paenibacillus senegalensis TaxID=1465766 RepID=UPI0002889117|nr:serine hydrolase domain-containing protein [Paenibacillus senegalensis]
MGIITDLPDHHGLPSKALIQFFNQIEQLNLQVNTFMLLQNGRATAQFWRPPYRKECPQLLFSLSKTFTSIAVGIARDRGWLELEDPVISFFPDKLPETISPNLAKMTIHHLLCMNAGHQHNIYPYVEREEDWVKAFLSQDVEHEPGTYYRYSTHSSYMLSAIIEKVTGQNLVDFLMPTLFEPLDIPRPAWETCPLGITAGGMGLSLRTEDIAKFGVMLLNNGMYEGNRIVSEDYLKMATAEQSDNRAGASRIDSAQGYGYQIHLCRRGCYRGDGAFGQLCFVAPKENIVVAATSSFKSGGCLQTLLNLIFEHILDPLDKSVTVRKSATVHESTTARESATVREDYMELQSLLAKIGGNPAAAHAPFPAERPAELPILHDYSYRLPMIAHNSTYTMSQNSAGIKTIRFLCREDGARKLQLIGHDLNRIIPFDFSKPVHTRDFYHKDLSKTWQEVVIYASLNNESTLVLTLYYIETPYVVTYTFIFKGQAVEFQCDINVSMNNQSMNQSAYSINGQRNTAVRDKIHIHQVERQE